MERGVAHSYLEAIVGGTKVTTKTVYNSATPLWNQALLLGCQEPGDKITFNLVDVMHNKLCFASNFEKWSTRPGRRERSRRRWLGRGLAEDMFTHTFTRMSRDGRVQVRMTLDVIPASGTGARGGEESQSSSVNRLGAGLGENSGAVIAGVVLAVLALLCCLFCTRCCCKWPAFMKHLTPSAGRQQGADHRAPAVALPEPSAPPMVPNTPMAMSMRPGYEGG